MSGSIVVPGFLTKIYEIFNSSEYNDCCGWGPDGDTIIIKKIDLFSKIVLPKYFKHANYQSFVRQLNMYDFRKTVQDPTNGEFHHQYFLKNRPDLLVYIKRKVHGRPEPAPIPPKKNATKPDKVVPVLPHDAVGNETETVLTELEQQSNMRSEIEKRLSALEQQHGQIVNENMFLRNLVVESANKQAIMQERMERIFRALYLYSQMNGGSNTLGGLLMGRSPNMLISDGVSNETKYIEGPSLEKLEGAAEQNNLDSGDEFGLGLDLRHQPSFDSVAASVSAPYEKDVNFKSNEGMPLERMASLDFPLTPSNPVNASSGSASFIIDPNLPGAGLRRLASFDYRGANTRKRDAPAAFEYNSDRVTELEPLPIQAPKKAKQDIPQSALSSVPSQMTEASSLTNSTNDQSIIQPQLEYLSLLQRNQDTTMARMDSLEMTIESLLNGVDFDDVDVNAIIANGTKDIEKKENVTA